jgi:hypothetical protein
MIDWFLGRLKVLALVALVSPFIGSAAQYYVSSDATYIAAHGVTVDADIVGAMRHKPGRLSSKYTLGVSWTDQAGVVRRDKTVRVPQALAETMLADGKLIDQKIRVIYLPNEPGRGAVTAYGNARDLAEPYRAALGIFVNMLPFGLAGGAVLWWLRRRAQHAGLRTAPDK